MPTQPQSSLNMKDREKKEELWATHLLHSKRVSPNVKYCLLTESLQGASHLVMWSVLQIRAAAYCQAEKQELNPQLLETEYSAVGCQWVPSAMEKSTGLGWGMEYWTMCNGCSARKVTTEQRGG